VAVPPPSLESLLEVVSPHEPEYRKSNRYFHSRVWRIQPADATPLALKVVEPKDELYGTLLRREHEFLQVLNDPLFVSYAFHGSVGDSYVLGTHWIDGYPLHENLARFLAENPNHASRLRFVDALRLTVERLEAAGIEHRDLWEKNILVRDGLPCLIDFGWAIWKGESDAPLPPELREPDDRIALAKLERSIIGTASSL
jgi:predicted Ser/Thr protein kinase